MTLPVFYRPEMSVADNPSFSPSAGKPAQAVADWMLNGLNIELRSFEPVTPAQLELVHDSRYVRDVLNGNEPNGFSNTDPAVAQACLYTCGSMLAAASHVAEHGGFACSPSSGFHHAHYDHGGGYCTFNGLALAARHLVLAHDRDVAIIDCDYHYGDGTHDILRRDFAWAKRVRHDTAGAKHFTRKDVQRFYNWLEAVVERACKERRVILYQAGADQHFADPLGGFLHTSQLSKRDSIVFRRAALSGIRVAFNLAGGYLRDETGSIEPVLDIHRNTVSEAARG